MQETDTKKLWHDVLETIKVSVSPAIFNTWFSHTHLISLKKDNNHFIAEVGCHSSFARDTIENRYFGLVQDTLAKSLETQCDIYFAIKENPDLKKGGDISSPLFEQEKPSYETIFETAAKVGLTFGFTFDNFAVSSSNQMAHAAAGAVTDNLGSAYNPLFIWGGVGVGKTHLMHAVGYSALEKDSGVNIYSCTGEQFTNDIVEGIRNKTTPAVRQKYRKLKALLVDDIQFIAGKDSVQEEFFHTFNALVSAGGQIILTSDKPPSEISKLEERLRSRFEAGLIVDIAPPDFELRCAIVQIKSKQKGLEIPMDMVQLIAGNLEAARKIEGLLVRLSSEAKIKNKGITPELIESILEKGSAQNGLVLKTTPIDIIAAVSKYYSIGKRVLLGTSRARPIARPRQILMYLLRTQLNLPLVQVGEYIGGRDHTTVIHAVEKITRLASNNVQIREDIRGIKQIL